MVKGQKSKKQAKKQVEERVEKMMDEEEMKGNDEEMMVTTISNEIKQYMHQEHCLDTGKILGNGIIGLDVGKLESKDFHTAKPNNIYPMAVMEFIRFLDTENLTTKVSYVNPNTHKT